MASILPANLGEMSDEELEKFYADTMALVNKNPVDRVETVKFDAPKKRVDRFEPVGFDALKRRVDEPITIGKHRYDAVEAPVWWTSGPNPFGLVSILPPGWPT